jgi:hypothetical protein
MFGIRDPGSEIRDPEKNSSRIPDPWGKKAPDPGSGSATLATTLRFSLRVQAVAGSQHGSGSTKKQAASRFKLL